MSSQTMEEQISAFDEVLLLTLFDIILQISRELLKQTDLLDPKTSPCTGFCLSYLRVSAGEKSALHSPEGTESSPGGKPEIQAKTKDIRSKGQNPSQQEQNPPEAKSSRRKRQRKITECCS